MRKALLVLASLPVVVLASCSVPTPTAPTRKAPAAIQRDGGHGTECVPWEEVNGREILGECTLEYGASGYQVSLG